MTKSRRRYRATLAYDGSEFQGYQRQKTGTPTVQGAVEDALAAISGQPVTVHGAGRTDTGVHATGQVIAFEMAWRHDTQALYRAINSGLPRSVGITSLCEAAADFHPRFDAVRRQYQYTLVLARHPLPLARRTAWIVLKRSDAFDLDAMAQAAAQLIGKRDFGALGTPPQGESTVREIFRSEWAQEQRQTGIWLTYTVEANAFLYRMVRRTVGMLYDVGRGRHSLEAFDATLQSGDVARGVTIAPPQGLVLTQVMYPDDVM